MHYPTRFLIFIVVLVFLQTFTEQSVAQGRGEIWSKNVELLEVLPGHTGHEYLWKEKVVVDGTEKIVIPEARNNIFRVVDVTDPRSVIVDAVQIEVRQHGSVELVTFGHAGHPIEANNAIWKDPSTASAPHGHTFGIVEVVPSTAVIVSGTSARFLIFDLTQAMHRAATSGSTSKTIVVGDVQIRSAHFDDVSGDFTDVYIGFIPENASTGAHNLRMEPEFGMMLCSGGATVDLQHIGSIFTNGTNGWISSSSTFAVPTQLTVSGGGAIPCDPGAAGDPLGSHEVNAEKIDDNVIRLYIAMYCTGSHVANGGVLIQDVDFTTPSSSTVTIKDHWNYHNDRTSPDHQFSTIGWGDWELSPCHTAVPKRYGGHTYMLTTDELGSPHADRETDGTPQRTFGGSPLEIQKASGQSSISGQTLINFIGSAKYDGVHEDYRMLGNYLRIWDYNESTPAVVGTGSGNGPLGLFDVPEQTADQHNAVTPTENVPILRVTQMDSIMNLSGFVHPDASSSTNNKFGVNTMHHVQSIDGDPDIYMSAYTQGARVISIATFPSSPSVIEKAYFDFYPTLTFDYNSNFSSPPDAVTFTNQNDYFCFNSGFGPSGNGYYHNFVSGENYPLYYMGIEDVMPDYGRSAHMEADEKFMYAMGWGGEGKADVLTETVDRNYIYGGGIFVLRYFEDKIGGTISGYDGTSGNTTYDRPYKEVNLQGTFEVSRNTTVASGATVNLLKGTILNQKSGGSEYLEIIGTVNVNTIASSVASADRGAINVEVYVRDGGKLIINDAAVIDFTKKVTVDPGGELTIKKDAHVAFANPENVCNGHLTIGTQGRDLYI